MHARQRRRRAEWLAPLLGRLVAVSWVIAFFVVAAAPVPTDEAEEPLLWLDVVVLGGSIAVLVGLAAGLAWLLKARLLLCVSLVAGSLGILMGIGCGETGHHDGGWWMYETASFALVTGLTAAALAAGWRARRT